MNSVVLVSNNIVWHYNTSVRQKISETCCLTKTELNGSMSLLLLCYYFCLFYLILYYINTRCRVPFKCLYVTYLKKKKKHAGREFMTSSRRVTSGIRQVRSANRPLFWFRRPNSDSPVSLKEYKLSQTLFIAALLRFEATF